MAQSQTPGQDIAGECLGRQRRQPRVKGQFRQYLDAELFQPMGAGGGIHQPKGGGVGGKELARMRLECDDAQGRIRAPGQVDHMAMATVDAIEISDGG